MPIHAQFAGSTATVPHLCKKHMHLHRVHEDIAIAIHLPDARDKSTTVNRCVCVSQAPWQTDVTAVEGHGGEAGEGVITTVRATRAFFGKPWFDTIVLHGFDARLQQKVVWHARLVALFKLRSTVHDSLHEQLALVRYLEPCNTGPAARDVLSEQGCTRVTWASGAAADGGDYQVVRLSSIVSKVRALGMRLVPWCRRPPCVASYTRARGIHLSACDAPQQLT